jgi:hypothetical protein
MKTIEDLGLGPLAAVGANLLVREFGYGPIQFTRGYSDLSGQARAMAKNVSRNRRWIQETYRPSSISKRLQDAVNRYIDLDDPELIEKYLYAEMSGIPNVQELSLHLNTKDGKPAAEAFDLVPVDGSLGEAIQNYIRALPNIDKFLTQEGGRIIWHAQFKERTPVKEV